MKITGNEPAFATPSAYTLDGCAEEGSYGLTKREYFAATAMQGFASNVGCNQRSNASLAKLSVEMADTLIKELNIV